MAVLWDCGVTYRKTQIMHLPNLKSPLEVGFVPSQDRGGRVPMLSGLTVPKEGKAAASYPAEEEQGKLSSRFLPEELSSI